MSPGALARRLLGDRAFRAAGRAYRAVFVDLKQEIAVIAAEIPLGAHVLDVGGGDGEPLDRLLALRPDIRVTTIDVSPRVGDWISSEHGDRVERHPATTLVDHLGSEAPLPDVLLLADVMHHVPPAQRPGFLGAVASLLKRRPGLRIVVKDVEPGHWRARLGYLSDRYVTGDANVDPVSREAMVRMFVTACGPLRWREAPLRELDPPNYVLVLER
jgi:hypothetical protein